MTRVLLLLAAFALAAYAGSSLERGTRDLIRTIPVELPGQFARL